MDFPDLHVHHFLSSKMRLVLFFSEYTVLWPAGLPEFWRN